MKCDWKQLYYTSRNDLIALSEAELKPFKTAQSGWMNTCRCIASILCQMSCGLVLDLWAFLRFALQLPLFLLRSVFALGLAMRARFRLTELNALLSQGCL
jgi:hypothetical protein